MLEAVNELTNLSDGLDSIRKVSAKLMSTPSPAADELVTVLQELSKTFEAIELELKRYLALDFSEANRPAARVDLLALEGGKVYERLGDIRAHCRKIGHIYWNELRPWFATAYEINDQERLELEVLFTSLEDSDGATIIPAIEQLAAWLTRKAETTLSHVDRSDYDEAVKDVRAARHEVLSLRRAIWRTSGELRDLEIQFTPSGAPKQTYPI